jgi:hypothetical protein
MIDCGWDEQWWKHDGQNKTARDNSRAASSLPACRGILRFVYGNC